MKRTVGTSHLFGNKYWMKHTHLFCICTAHLFVNKYQNKPIYDKLWASVMKAVPKLDESESGQMVLK